MRQSRSNTTIHTSPVVTIACFIIIVAGMKAAAPLLNPLFLALFTAIICWPILTWLERKKVPSGIAVTLVVFGLFIVLTIIGAYIVSAVNQFSRALPVYQVNLFQQTSRFINWLHDYGISFPQETEFIEELNAGKVMRFAGTLLSGLRDVFTNVFFILLTVIFLLFEFYEFPHKIRCAFGNSKLNDHTAKIVSSLNQYLGIKLITSLVTGLLIATWLALLGVDFPVLWGVMAFILNFVPNIGSIIAAIPTVLLTLVQLGGNTALLVVLGYFAINMLVGNVWEPRIMGRDLGLSTLVVFLSLTFWGWVFGSVGMLLSVPFTMIAKIILENNASTCWIAILLGSGEDLKIDNHK